MKTCAFLVLAGLITSCAPAPKPDARIAILRHSHHAVDSLQTVAVRTMTKLDYDTDRIEAEKKEVAGLLQQSTATLAQLDQLDPADTKEGAGAAQLAQLLTQEGRLLRTTMKVQADAVQAARELRSVKSLMNAN